MCSCENLEAVSTVSEHNKKLVYAGLGSCGIVLHIHLVTLEKLNHLFRNESIKPIEYNFNKEWSSAAMNGNLNQMKKLLKIDPSLIDFLDPIFVYLFSLILVICK
ncbi:hypothetical protein HZS_6292 [Henneguya salminicola]|nr:hypothetical protein HZS_6292 [Henneguya salminicola]